MRLWSLHPESLDSRGLTALWREALLARAVLKGETEGYLHHPQLERFRRHPRPVRAINAFLYEVWKEARRRGYAFDRRKLGRGEEGGSIPVTRGQVIHERSHLLKKLKRRDPERWRKWVKRSRWPRHPLFQVRSGPVEPWERLP